MCFEFLRSCVDFLSFPLISFHVASFPFSALFYSVPSFPLMCLPCLPFRSCFLSSPFHSVRSLLVPFRSARVNFLSFPVHPFLLSQHPSVAFPFHWYYLFMLIVRLLHTMSMRPLMLWCQNRTHTHTHTTSLRLLLVRFDDRRRTRTIPLLTI